MTITLENAVTIIQKQFRYKKNIIIFLNKDMNFLYNIIINIFNNINNCNFISKITLNEYFKYTKDIESIKNKWFEINSKISFKGLIDGGFFKINMKIYDIKLLLKKNSIQICSSNIKNNIKLFYNNTWCLNIKEKYIDLINFYNEIFIPTSSYIDNKKKYLSRLKNKEEGYVFFNKIIPRKNNVIEEIHGGTLHLFINNKILVLNGYFCNDNANILKSSIHFKKKKNNINRLITKINGDNSFTKKYLEQISLKNFILCSPKNISEIIKLAKEKSFTYKSMTLNKILNIFMNSNFDKQREMLTILILSEYKLAGLASVIYDILTKKVSKDKAKHLYLSLHMSVQKLFDIALDDFKEENKKLQDISDEDIPFDKRIQLSKASDNAKLKAMEKFKSMSGGGLFGSSGDNKAQQWLNGFLKIPFGRYKENPIISFINNFSYDINNYLESLKNSDSQFYPDLNILFNNCKGNNIQLVINYFQGIIDDSNKSLNNEIKEDFLSFTTRWHDYTQNRSDYIKEVRYILDEAVYGNDEGKRQIEGIIGQWINGKNKGSILGFQGPPGVGKTTLAKRGLCRCLMDDDGKSRPFVFIPLGGSSNGSVLEGHGYTYIGSIWGKIVDVLMESECMNPIIFFDEVDKISYTEHGREIIGILTHLTDLTQNDEFSDKYFAGIKIDLSKVLFIFSYNDTSLIDPILRDRITEIKVKPLTTKDKVKIVNSYLLPEILDDVGYNNNDIKFTNDDIIYIIDTYTYEAGVRKLKEKLVEIIRNINLDYIYGENITFPYTIPNEKIVKILETKPKMTFKKIIDKPRIGLVNGLYATSAGVGGITLIEVFKTHSDSNFAMTLTGQQGDVMKESMKCAKTIAWNIIPKNIKNNITEDWKENGSWGIHIHCPDGATPKDGPSAGGAITLAIISQLTQIPVKNDIAMTGEIDLNGNIKQIGGLVSKLNGAKKAGVKKVLISDENIEDLELIRKQNLSPESDDFIVISVKSIYDILNHALIDNDLEFSNYLTL
jgi:hypothetical protein